MAAIICPTITAQNTEAYREQMERIAPFAVRVPGARCRVNPDELPAGIRLVGPGAPSDASETGSPNPTSEATEEGGEQLSRGSSSQASTGRQPSSDEPNSPSHPRPARTTGRRSRKDQAASDSADSTDGSGLETT